MKMKMKKSLLLSLLLTASVTVFGQTTGNPKTITSIDTIYIIHGTDVNRIYNLLSLGYNGVATSDNFSKNQAGQYQKELAKVDSVFRPQILKWYPVKKK